MKRYKVVVSPAARQQVADQGRFIAEQSGSLEVALRWVDRIYESIDTLDFSPHRYELAEENRYRDYEIRRLLIGKYLALYFYRR